MRALKDLAVEYNTIVIVVGQPRKPLANHRGREAVTQDLKGSESFGSDASQVFILHRDRKSNGDDENMPIFDPVTKVKLDKSRESEPRATKLFFDGARCTFTLLERNLGEYDE
jgi:replicative DNA helicase